MSAPIVRTEEPSLVDVYRIVIAHVGIILLCFFVMMPAFWHSALPVCLFGAIVLGQIGLLGIAVSLSTAAEWKRFAWAVCGGLLAFALAMITHSVVIGGLLITVLIGVLCTGGLLRMCDLAIRRVRMRPASGSFRFTLANLFAVTATIAIALTLMRWLFLLNIGVRPHAQAIGVDSPVRNFLVALLFGVSPYVAMAAALCNYSVVVRTALALSIGILIGQVMQVLTPFTPSWFWSWLVLAQGTVVFLTCLLLRFSGYKIVDFPEPFPGYWDE